MDLFESGFEIADHTTTHPALGNLTKPEVAQEIAGFKTEIAKCGVPERCAVQGCAGLGCGSARPAQRSPRQPAPHAAAAPPTRSHACSAVVGFRAPFFEQTPEVRQVLHEQGFLYDRWGAEAACALLSCCVCCSQPGVLAAGAATDTSRQGGRLASGPAPQRPAPQPTTLPPAATWFLAARSSRTRRATRCPAAWASACGPSPWAMAPGSPPASCERARGAGGAGMGVVGFGGRAGAGGCGCGACGGPGKGHPPAPPSV